jgi:hypothetical protein
VVSRFGAARRVGEIVYPPYKPQRLGKVIGIVGPTSDDPYAQRLRIRWADGRVQEQRGADVLRLDDLIDDHRAKLQRHEAKRAQAKLSIPDE